MGGFLSLFCLSTFAQETPSATGLLYVRSNELHNLLVSRLCKLNATHTLCACVCVCFFWGGGKPRTHPFGCACLVVLDRESLVTKSEFDWTFRTFEDESMLE